jgi:hypothetical protein
VVKKCQNLLNVQINVHQADTSIGQVAHTDAHLVVTKDAHLVVTKDAHLVVTKDAHLVVATDAVAMKDVISVEKEAAVVK